MQIKARATTTRTHNTPKLHVCASNPMKMNTQGTVAAPASITLTSNSPRDSELLKRFLAQFVESGSLGLAVMLDQYEEIKK